MDRRMSSPRVTTSRPRTVAAPAVGASSPQRMRINVHLPDPFVPSSLLIVTARTERSIASSATNVPNVRDTPRARMASGASSPVERAAFDTAARPPSLRHADERGHPGPELVEAVSEPDPGREHLIGALV